MFVVSSNLLLVVCLLVNYYIVVAVWYRIVSYHSLFVILLASIAFVSVGNQLSEW